MQEGIKSFWILTKFLYRKLDAFLSTPGFIGEIWQALKNVIGGIYDKIMSVVNSVKETIFKFFGSEWMQKLKGAVEWMQKLKGAVQKGILSALFPIVTIMKIYRWLREKIDSTITKIPVIGKIYTKFKEVTKDISSGTT